MYTWQRTSAQRNTFLLLLWRRSDGQEQSVSSSGTMRTGTKTSSPRMRNFSPSRSCITTRVRFMLNHPLRYILRVQGCYHPSCVMVWWEVSHQGMTHLHFCKKGVKLVSKRIKKMCYKELWNSLTWPSSVVRNGSSSRIQFLPKSQDDSEVGVEERSSLYQCRGWPSGSPHLNPRNYKLWTWLAKGVTTTWTIWRDPLWKQGQIPLETVRAVIAERPEHLKACAEAEGSHFEWH